MSSLPVSRIQRRALWARTNADLLVNDPGGMVVTNGPVPWDFDTSGGNYWWLGSDGGGGAYPVGPNGPWVGQSSILPAVTRCTTVIATAVARRQLWRFVDRDGAVRPRPLWVEDPMGAGRLPGPVQGVLPSGLRLDGHSFFETWLTHAVWWGLGAFVYVENTSGEPTAGTLRLLNPYLVGVGDDGRHVIDPNGDTPIRTDEQGRFIAGGKVWRLAVLRGLTPNDHRTPEGVLTRHFDTFRLGAAVSQYVANTFSGMGVPAGLLKVSTPGFKKDDAEALKASWMAAHGAGRRSVAVLNSTVDFQPLALTPVDSDSATLTRVTRTDIAHAFGLSSVWLDEGATGLTYQNDTGRRRDLVDISLAGWSEAMSATLSALMPFGQWVEIDWRRFTQPTLADLAQPLSVLLAAGVLTAGEARAELGYTQQSGPDPAWSETSPAALGVANESLPDLGQAVQGGS